MPGTWIATVCTGPSIRSSVDPHLVHLIATPYEERALEGCLDPPFDQVEAIVLAEAGARNPTPHGRGQAGAL